LNLLPYVRAKNVQSVLITSIENRSVLFCKMYSDVKVS